MQHPVIGHDYQQRSWWLTPAMVKEHDVIHMVKLMLFTWSNMIVVKHMIA
jgi:hypothetical protein